MKVLSHNLNEVEISATEMEQYECIQWCVEQFGKNTADRWYSIVVGGMCEMENPFTRIRMIRAKIYPYRCMYWFKNIDDLNWFLLRYS